MMLVLPLVAGAAVVGGASYWATKNSGKVVSMANAVRTWINKKFTKEVPQADQQ